MVQHLVREVYKTFTPLNQDISVMLNEMEMRDSASPPCKNRGPIGTNHEQYCRYYWWKGHSTDDCKLVKKDIEALILNRLLKNFVEYRWHNSSPRRDRRASPTKEKGQDASRAKKGTCNVISVGFAKVGKHPRGLCQPNFRDRQGRETP